MKKIILIHGLIAGAITGGMLFLTMPLFKDGTLNMDNGQWIGYSTMVVALSLVFFGIKNIGDKHLSGQISFGKAFMQGMLITLIAGVVYALSWEVCYHTVASGFMENYSAQYLEKLKSSGISESQYQAAVKEMNDFSEMYKNPMARFGLTVMEILPVGLAISLISALVLKRKATTGI